MQESGCRVRRRIRIRRWRKMRDRHVSPLALSITSFLLHLLKKKKCESEMHTETIITALCNEFSKQYLLTNEMWSAEVPGWLIRNVAWFPRVNNISQVYVPFIICFSKLTRERFRQPQARFCCVIHQKHVFSVYRRPKQRKETWVKQER